MAGKKIGVLVGSLRKGSYTRMVAKAMCGLNPDLQCEIIHHIQQGRIRLSLIRDQRSAQFKEDKFFHISILSHL